MTIQRFLISEFFLKNSMKGEFSSFLLSGKWAPHLGPQRLPLHLFAYITCSI